MLVGTFEALLLGFEEPTVGLVAEAPGVPATPGTAVAPGAAGNTPTLPFPPPPPLLPHPASEADSSNAMIQPQVVAVPRLQLLISASMKLFPLAASTYVALSPNALRSLPHIRHKKRILAGPFPFFAIAGLVVATVAAQGGRHAAVLIEGCGGASDSRSLFALQHLLQRYTPTLITRMAQTAVCNRHRAVEQQLCRWRLLGLGRLPSNELTMTQDRIARMPGERREDVAEAACHLWEHY